MKDPEELLAHYHTNAPIMNIENTLNSASSNLLLFQSLMECNKIPSSDDFETRPSLFAHFDHWSSEDRMRTACEHSGAANQLL